jgi:predicted Zn-dependent peptidase
MANINYEESKLENGLRIITSTNDCSGVVNIDLVVKAGARYESDGESGYAHMLEHMLLKGTAKMPGNTDIYDSVEKNGAFLNALTNVENVSIKSQVVTEQSEFMFELIDDVLINSTIDPVTLENEKKVVIEEIKRADQDGERVLRMKALKGFFGGHPMARIVPGTKDTVNEMSDSKLKDYRERTFIPSQSALITTGNLSHERALELSKKYFSDWNGEQKDNVALFEPEVTKEKYVFYEFPSKQSFIYICYPTKGVSDLKEFAALELVAGFVGEGSASLLSKELRSKEGLVYSQLTLNTSYVDAGIFEIRTATSKPKEATDIIVDIVNGCSKSINEEILQEIKNKKIAQFKRIISNPSSEISFLGRFFVLLNRMLTPAEYISMLSEVTIEDIKNAAEKYLTKEQALVAVLGPKE